MGPKEIFLQLNIIRMVILYGQEDITGRDLIWMNLLKLNWIQMQMYTLPVIVKLPETWIIIQLNITQMELNSGLQDIMGQPDHLAVKTDHTFLH